MIPYIKTTRNNNTIECNVDLAIIHNNCPIIISSVDISVSVKKLMSDIIQDYSNITLLDRGNIFLEYSLRSYDEKFKYKLTKHDDIRTHGIAYNSRQNEYIFDWNNEGLVKCLSTHLREKHYMPVTDHIVKKVLAVAGEDKIVDKCDVYTTQEELKNMNVWHVGSAEAFKYYLSEVDLQLTDDNDDFDWDNIEDISDYLVNFVDPIKEKLEENIDVLYDESKISDKINGNIKLYNGQIPIVQGGIETLKRKNNRFIYLAAEQGSGKSIMGAKINHVYHIEKGKENYCTLAVVPAITLTQWKEEIEKVVGDNVDVLIIKNTDQFIRFYNRTKMKVNKPTYILVGKETFKLSYKVEHGVNVKRKTMKFQRKNERYDWLDTVKEEIEVCLCPDCGTPQKNPLRKTEDVFFTEKDYDKPKKSNYKCSNCDSVLFQAVYDKTKKTSVAEFIKRRKIQFSSILIDEIHESNNASSIIGRTTRDIMKYGKKIILMSGTVTNGYASSIHNILSALIPNTLKKENVFEKEQFVKAFGTLVAVTKNKDSDYYVTSRTAVKESAFKEVEGINPLVYTKFFASSFIFSTLSDLKDDLPPLNEQFIEIKHDKEVLKNEKDLTEDIKKANAFSASFYDDSVIKHYTNNPFSWKEIPFRFKEGSEKMDEIVYPVNIEDRILPKERELIKICKEQKEKGEQVWVYCDFVTNGKYTEGTLPLQDRLKFLLEQSGLSVFVLKANISPTQRRSVIEKARKQGYNVFISHPKLISVGINLQWCTNYVFYTPSYHVNTVKQASKRGRRINSTKQNNVYHLYYNDGVEKQIMNRFQLKLVESDAIQNRFITSANVQRTASNLGAKIEKELVAAF